MQVNSLCLILSSPQGVQLPRIIRDTTTVQVLCVHTAEPASGDQVRNGNIVEVATKTYGRFEASICERIGRSKQEYTDRGLLKRMGPVDRNGTAGVAGNGSGITGLKVLSLYHEAGTALWDVESFYLQGAVRRSKGTQRRFLCGAQITIVPN
jgi:hypothetical protein